MNKRISLSLAGTIIPLTLGAVIYLTSGSRTYITDFISRFGLILPRLDYPLLIRCYACDFLWAFALLSGLTLIYRDKDRSTLIKVITASFIIAVAMEGLQAIPSFPGTFDLWDVTAELLAILIAAVITILFARRLINEKEKDY